MPFTVPCTQVAPAWTAAIAAAVPSPKSSWPCQCTGTSRRSSARETRNAAASGVAIPSVSTTTASAAPASTAASYARSKNSRSAREESTPKNATRIPCPVANATALRMRSSIVSRETPRASSLPSEIGLSITEADTPSSTSTSTSACTAREKPQTSALSPAAAIALTASKSSAETRGNPASIRSIPAASRARAISSFSSGVSTTPIVCSPSRSVVS